MNLEKCFEGNLNKEEIFKCSQFCSREIFFDLLDNKKKYTDEHFNKCSDIVNSYKNNFLEENKNLKEFFKKN